MNIKVRFEGGPLDGETHEHQIVGRKIVPVTEHLDSRWKNDPVHGPYIGGIYRKHTYNVASGPDGFVATYEGARVIGDEA